MSKEFPIITRARELIERIAFDQTEARSQARAMEAAMRFAGQPHQESQAVFVADSESEFDVLGLRLGSIFRVRYERTEIHYIHHQWYVVGDRKDNKRHVYKIIFGAYSDNRSHARLSFTPGFHVTRVRPHQPVFPVSEAHEVLGEVRKDNTFLVTQIDVMSAGILERVNRTDDGGSCEMQQGQGVLVPVPNGSE